MSYNSSISRNRDHLVPLFQRADSSTDEDLQSLRGGISDRVDGISRRRMDQFQDLPVQNIPIRNSFTDHLQERSSPSALERVFPSARIPVRNLEFSSVNAVWPSSGRNVDRSVALREEDIWSNAINGLSNVSESYESGRSALRQSLGLDQTELDINSPSEASPSYQSSRDALSLSLSLEQRSYSARYEPSESDQELGSRVYLSELEELSYQEQAETVSIVRPKKREYSDEVQESRNLRRAVEISFLNHEDLEPSKYSEMVLPTKAELHESQFDYSHIEHQLRQNEIPDAPGDVAYSDFARILVEYSVPHTLPEIIEDEGEEYSRVQFLSLFESHIQDMIDYRPVSNDDLNDRARAQQSKVLSIQKYLKHVINHFLVENEKIEHLPIAEKAAAREKIKASLTKHFTNLGHGTLHCSDRIKQESELMYHELCGGDDSSSEAIETTEDRLFKHIDTFRNEVFKEVVAHYAARYPSRRGVDLASSVEYYQNQFQRELNLRESGGTEYTSYVNTALSQKIRNKFYRRYTPKSMVGYLKENAKYSDLYKWFQERYDVPHLGFKISNEDCDNLNDEAVVYLLQKIRVID